jgi:HAE1 family hydrophobic/amphiphilic exporter-1
VRGLAAALALLVGLLRLLLAPLAFAFDRLWRVIEELYPRLLSASLSASWLVLLAVGLLGWLAARRVPALGLDLLPEIHQGEFTALVGLEVGSPLESTERVLSELDASVRGMEGVALTALVVGVEKETLTREIEGEHTARLTVRLDPVWLAAAAERGESPSEAEERLTAAVRRRIAEHPAVRALDVRRPTPFALEAPVQVEVLGHDLEEIALVASDVVDRLGRLPGLSDVESSIRPGHPEARVVFDRDKMLEYGLDLATVSSLVRDQVLGTVGTRYVEGDDRIDVRVLGDEIELSTLDRVLDLVVNPAAPTPIPLRAVARATVLQGPAEIRRVGNSRAVVVDAAGSGLDLGGLAAAVEGELEDLVPPEQVAVRLGGQKREMDEAQASMRFALALALFLVYVVMACQFESLLQPLIILLSAPLAAVGVIFVLDLLDIPLSVVVFIGLILLAGVVVNNAIVLLDRANQMRARGMALREAIMEAGRVRLRPIYMTTATTVLGLLPLTGWLEGLPLIGALSGGQGAELRAPMAITVIAGLTCSTLLTLVVIPIVYHLVQLPGERRRMAAAESAAGARA